jgi:hypothetical protein
VDENVLAAGIRLNEAEALLAVEPLDGTGVHGKCLSISKFNRRATPPHANSPIDVLEEVS